MSVSGAYLACVINGQELAGVHEWSADDSGTDRLDRTSGADRGYTNTDTGCYDLVLTVRFYFDVATGSTVAIQTGTILEDVIAKRHIDDAVPAYELPEALVIGKPVTVQVRGRVEVTATIKNRGGYNEDGVGGF